MILNISGYKVLIDDKDYDLVKDYKWYVYINKSGYKRIIAKKKNKNISFARTIMIPNLNEEVDHINHNTLDNRRCNLRICTHQENCYNLKTRKDNSLGVKGLWFNKKTNKYVAVIRTNGKKVFQKYFNNISDAKREYDKKAKEIFKEFACLN
jgi:hypothetical protein